MQIQPGEITQTHFASQVAFYDASIRELQGIASIRPSFATR